jgi:hypothetical protein
MAFSGMTGMIDQASLRQGTPEQSVEPGMILGQQAVKRTRHAKGLLLQCLSHLPQPGAHLGEQLRLYRVWGRRGQGE